MMNNAEIIKGIDLVIEGLTTIKKSIMVVDGADESTEAPKRKSVAEKVQKEEPMNPPVGDEDDTADVVVAGEFDAEQLKSMKYNDFKKLAASLGVKCTGTRDEIMERILALNNDEATGDVVEDADDEEEVVEEDTKSVESPKGKKLGKKKTDESSKDEFDLQAEEIAKETDVEDIIESLAEVDIKANKKNAVTLLAKALREGLIELDDDEDEEDEEEADESDEVVEADEDEEVEIEADSYFPEYDPNGYNDPAGMTEERAEAIEAKMDEILTAISEGKLTQEEIESYIEDNATEAEIDLLGEEYEDEDLIKMYMELVKRTIDNDGDEHEPGEPYEVADKDVCCGHELNYVKKAKKYVCSHCGTEYEAE